MHCLRLGALLIGVAVVAAGCGPTDPPSFKLDMPLMILNEINDSDQIMIANVLEAIMGTPDKPRAPAGSSLQSNYLRMSAGPVWSNEAGTKHGLYREHCAHCHGVSGDGRGPTAMFLNPYPRDYRRGVYKFKSTDGAARPTHDDLYRILYNGINGTAMPSFKLLPSDEVNALAEYVQYLSIRGELERALIEYIVNDIDEDDDGEALPFDPTKFPDQMTVVQELFTGILDEWNAADEAVMRPDESMLPDPARAPAELTAAINHGRELFMGVAECRKCHGPTALGDGQRDDWTVWNKFSHDYQLETEQLAESIERGYENLGDLEGDARDGRVVELEVMEERLDRQHEALETLFPPRNAIPRNLRAGIFRGGRRPLDIYWRIRSGINGAPMPKAVAQLTEKDIWDLVAYVRSLPYEPASNPQTQLTQNERARP